MQSKWAFLNVLSKLFVQYPFTLTCKEFFEPFGLLHFWRYLRYFLILCFFFNFIVVDICLVIFFDFFFQLWLGCDWSLWLGGIEFPTIEVKSFLRWYLRCFKEEIDVKGIRTVHIFRVLLIKKENVRALREGHLVCLRGLLWIFYLLYYKRISKILVFKIMTKKIRYFFLKNLLKQA